MIESKSEGPYGDGFNRYIECNAADVIVIEAKLKWTMSKLLKNPRATLDDNLQCITCFDYGGFSLSLCLSHKVAYLATTVNFLQYWVTNSKSGIDHQLTPLNLFKVEFLFPMYYLMLVDVGLGDKKCVTRRFVFEASKISVLKNSIACEVKSPSRVEVVMALLYKCAISVSTKGSPIILLQTMNLR
ncbi:hypothetical protein FEM48_Zijuj10G0040400 [Ziziphus jujuba var. spinosa]|uniref:Uncharacterized protein n=1 Tax=Ziziphus jujuba var. spinosa TaxID=714518 RepID=A0A978UL65_ZIZJJ|nr:hypothetical protein FEM48_Zijuj10G0040400 [Ziziphus jujuba var. spinosa]